MNIIVLGAGAFGTAIANELSVNTENNAVLFSRNKEKVEEIVRLKLIKPQTQKIKLKIQKLQQELNA